MKKLVYLLLLISSIAYADVSTPVEFTEEDGSPSVYGPYKVKFGNASLTDNSDGTISVALGTASNISCSDCVALTTETSGNYVASLTEGTGIDVDAASEGGTPTVALDMTELTNQTWGDGTQATLAETFNVSSGTDPSITASASLLAFNTAISVAGSGGATFGDNADSFYLTTYDISTTDVTQRVSADEVSWDGTVASGGGSQRAGVFKLYEDSDNGAQATTFTVPAMAANVDYVLPPDDGDNTEVLQTDGAGVLTWVAAGGGTTWNSIGDATGAGTVDFAGFDQDITSEEDGDILTITNTSTDAVNVSTVLTLAHNDSGDNQVGYLSMIADADGTPSEIFRVGQIPGTTSAIIELGETGVTISDDGDGLITITGKGTGADENMTINLDDGTNTINMGSGTSALYQFNVGVTFGGNNVQNDDVNFSYGSSTDSQFQWDTTEGSDSLKLGLIVNSTTARSGNFGIVELADIDTNFSWPNVLNPTLRVQSSDATTSSDNVVIYHDQTNGNLETGSGVLKITPRTGQITLDGTTAAGGCLMIQDTDNAGWTECDVLNGVMSCSTDADGVCD